MPTIPLIRCCGSIIVFLFFLALDPAPTLQLILAQDPVPNLLILFKIFLQFFVLGIYILNLSQSGLFVKPAF